MLQFLENVLRYQWEGHGKSLGVRKPHKLMNLGSKSVFFPENVDGLERGQNAKPKCSLRDLCRGERVPGQAEALRST